MLPSRRRKRGVSIGGPSPRGAYPPDTSRGLGCECSFFLLLLPPYYQVFDHLNATFRNPQLGRMTAAALEEKVQAVLAVWAEWSIYPPRFLSGLEAAFFRKPAELDAAAAEAAGSMGNDSNSGGGGSGGPAGAAAAALAALGLDELERRAKHSGVWVDPERDLSSGGARLAGKLALDEAYRTQADRAGAGASAGGGADGSNDDDDDDVDGEALDASGSGAWPTAAPAWGLGGTAAPAVAPAPGGQWSCLSRGFVALGAEGGEEEEEEDVDGVPMDDGAVAPAAAPSPSSSKKRRRPMGTERAKPSKYAGLGASRFSDESGSEDDEDGGGSGADGEAQATASASGLSGAARAAVRAVEVAVLRRRDELEEQGAPSEEVERECAALRQALLAQAEQ